MKYLIALNSLLMLGIYIYNQQPEPEQEEAAVVVSKADSYPENLSTIEIVLQKQYLDGRRDTETYMETITAMEDFWYAYENYQLIDQKVGQMVFREYVNDISPYLKEVGYFGLMGKQLVIFEGEPQYNQNIQTVYEIDIGILSEKDQEQLQKGIKIDSKQTYEEVIDVFRHQIPSEEVHGESD